MLRNVEANQLTKSEQLEMIIFYELFLLIKITIIVNYTLIAVD